MITDQNISGRSIINRGPGSTLSATSAPNNIAVVPEPGMPSVSNGTNEPVQAALFAVSGAANPLIEPRPNSFCSSAVAMLRSDADFAQIARALALPVTALTFTVVAHMARMTRAAVLNVLSSPAVEMAILKGVPRTRILLVHALPNALAPIINVIALNLAYLISGIVVIESLFNFTGLGRLMVEAVTTRDIPVVQACAMIFCSIYVLLNMAADIISILANPRIRHPK